MVAPICTLEDLWNWSEGNVGKITKQRLMNYRDKRKDGKPEIMICHDMKGGYLDEESDDGITVTLPSVSNPYVFLNWWNIDIFCYFSHNFISIPPSGYTHVAHIHGCLTLGTFITEWKGGAKLCQEFLASEETVIKTVDRLIAIAVHHSFDGWLINIENDIKTEQIDNLKSFLRLLTDGMRKAVRHSRVIWYDSVTVTGELSWQNMLNEQNKAWYDHCDGIYLNYNWTDEALLSSADFGTLNKIYLGIDCFARGCIGGWDCYRSFAKANLMRMSIALFAPGWICQKFPTANPIEYGLKFWKKLALYTPLRPILELPVSTNFCAGFTVDPVGMRFRISSISLQPHFVCPLSQLTPTIYGHLILSKRSCIRIFNFDVTCTGCRVNVKADGDIKLMINDIIMEAKKDRDEYIVTITCPIHLNSLDICTSDDVDSCLYHALVEEI